MPDKPTLDGIERKWDEVWEAQGTYAFDRTATREEIYSIDTSPPTVSGSLHMGSVFGYAQTDAIARYQRMRGKKLFYPMGWDDNGLPTERRVQNYYGVRCDPSLHYDPSFEPPAKPGKDQLPISRRNFVELCMQLTEEDERAFEQLWRRVGLSVDWSNVYRTISETSLAKALHWSHSMRLRPSARIGTTTCSPLPPVVLTKGLRPSPSSSFFIVFAAAMTSLKSSPSSGSRSKVIWSGVSGSSGLQPHG